MRHRFQHFLKIFVYSDPKFANKARIPKKNSKFNPFVIKADLGTNCKSFRKKQQEKFSIQKVKHSQKKSFQQGGNYIYEYKEVKEKLHPVSVDYVWTTLEHQVKNKYVFRKVKLFSGLRGPETHFMHAHGHQRTNAWTSSIFISKHNN